MLEALSAISTRLYWTKPIALLLGTVFFGVFVTSIFDLGGFDSDALLIPGLLGVIWSATYYLFLNIFPSVPSRPGVEVKLFTRAKIRFQRGMYYLLGLILVALSVVLLFLSFKLLGIWRAEF